MARHEWTKKEAVVSALIAGIFAVFAALVTGVFSLITDKPDVPALSLVRTPDLQLVDVSAVGEVIDIKLKNTGNDPVLVKEIMFYFSSVSLGNCGPLRPSQYYVIEGSVGEILDLLNNDSTSKEPKLELKVSQVVPAHGVDRFQIALKLKEPKWSECLNQVLIKGHASILFDERGVIESDEITMWLHHRP